MPTTTFSQDEIQSLVNEIKVQLIPELVQELHRKELPPLLDRKQFMELVGIGDSKCAELFNRQDFPVNREFGHPRVPTQLLFEWIHNNTDWVDAHMPEFKYPSKAM